MLPDSSTYTVVNVIAFLLVSVLQLIFLYWCMVLRIRDTARSSVVVYVWLGIVAALLVLEILSPDSKGTAIQLAGFATVIFWIIIGVLNPLKRPELRRYS